MHTLAIFIPAASPAQLRRRKGKTRQTSELEWLFRAQSHSLQATKTVTSAIPIKLLCYSVVVICFGRTSIAGCDLEFTTQKQQTSDQLNLI